MLARLREVAEKEDLPVKTIECSWWNADIDELGLRGKFDLVIGSMTPGDQGCKDVRTDDGLFEKALFLYRFPARHRSPGDAGPLKEHQQVAGPPPVCQGMVFPFMYLYLKGYQPAIKITGRKWTEDLPWADAADHAIDILSPRPARDRCRETEDPGILQNNGYQRELPV